MGTGIDMICWIKHVIVVWYPELENCAPLNATSADGLRDFKPKIGPRSAVMTFYFRAPSLRLRLALRFECRGGTVVRPPLRCFTSVPLLTRSVR